MSLARRLDAGIGWLRWTRRTAIIEFAIISAFATRRECFVDLAPALKGRAKFRSTLRVETTSSDLALVAEAKDTITD
jgi:predicted small integral membrane protein